MNSVLEKESSVLERSDIKDINLAEQGKNNIEWALKEGAKRIEAETDPNNKASQRVLEKCGFIPLGINGLEGPRFIYKII